MLATYKMLHVYKKKPNCKYNFLCEIFGQAGYTTKAISVTAEEYGPSKAARTFNSKLYKRKLAEANFTLLYMGSCIKWIFERD